MPVTVRALVAAVVIVAIVGQPSTVRAAEAPCVADPERPATRPVAPAAVAADLAEPFRYVPAGDDRAALLAEVASVVSEQAADGDAEPCYLEKPARIASRVDFLSPFEFLVLTVFDQEPARRDALLDLYPSDPRGAIKQLGETFPSPRAQATLTAFAYYDVDTDRIRVNAAKVPPEQLRRVLVHEFWHAMPRARTWTETGRSDAPSERLLAPGAAGGPPRLDAGRGSSRPAVRLPPARRGDGDVHGDALRRAVAVRSRTTSTKSGDSWSV